VLSACSIKFVYLVHILLINQLCRWKSRYQNSWRKWMV